MLGNFVGFYTLATFLETICWEFFWKLYAGKFSGNYILEKLKATTVFEECYRLPANCYGTLDVQRTGNSKQ